MEEKKTKRYSKRKPQPKSEKYKPKQKPTKQLKAEQPIVDEIIDAEVIQPINHVKGEDKYVVSAGEYKYTERALAIRDGLAMAAVRKYGSIEGWYDHIMNMAHTNPMMVRLILEYIVGKPQAVDTSTPRDTSSNTIKLGFANNPE